LEIAEGTAMELVRDRIGRAPGIGKVAAEIHLVVAFEEAAEEEVVDSSRLRVAGVGSSRFVGFDGED
jgi:hypothetical protein